MATASLKSKPPLNSVFKKYMYRTTSPFCHHLRSSHQTATKSQSRCQSTYNSSISSCATRPPQQHVKAPNPIQTVFKTALDDELVPKWLIQTYWWAYTDEKAVHFWERQWLVDAILWGNFNVLKTEAIKEIHSLSAAPRDEGVSVTQIACVYGNFSSDLLAEMISMDIAKNGDCLKIVDIAPVQLINTKRKIDSFLSEEGPQRESHHNLTVGLYQNDSSNLESIATESEDICYLFFLLHEQPKEVRLKTIAETLRSTRHINGK